jgi:hypothetical protein
MLPPGCPAAAPAYASAGCASTTTAACRAREPQSTSPSPVPLRCAESSSGARSGTAPVPAPARSPLRASLGSSARRSTPWADSRRRWTSLSARSQREHPIRFWFLQGAAVVPGGVPIVPGVFHLVGGIVGAGWHVRLDPVNRSLISETAGIVPPPPLVPDASRSLLLRGGLIFADPSLQLYRLSATATVNLGSGLLLSLDGDIRVLPTVRLAEGTAYANISLPGGNLRGATISLGGSVTVRLLVTDDHQHRLLCEPERATASDSSSGPDGLW